MRYRFHPEARLEYLEAVAHYEGRQTGLGARFTAEIESTIQRIVEAPNRWHKLEGEVRRCLSHIFPYGVLYTVEVDTITCSYSRSCTTVASQVTGAIESVEVWSNDLLAFCLLDGGIYTSLFWFVWILAGGLFPLGILFHPERNKRTPILFDIFSAPS